MAPPSSATFCFWRRSACARLCAAAEWTWGCVMPRQIAGNGRRLYLQATHLLANQVVMSTPVTGKSCLPGMVQGADCATPAPRPLLKRPQLVRKVQAPAPVVADAVDIIIAGRLGGVSINRIMLAVGKTQAGHGRLERMCVHLGA